MLETPFMTIWREAIEENVNMLKDESRANQYFLELMEKYKNDGMVYYEYAEAMEYRGDFETAKECYEKAKELFPLKNWQSAAENSLLRINRKIKGNCQNIVVKNNIDTQRWDIFHLIHTMKNVPTHIKFKSYVCTERIKSDLIIPTALFRICCDVMLQDIYADKDYKNSDENMCNLIDYKVGKTQIQKALHRIRLRGNYAIHEARKEQIEIKEKEIDCSKRAILEDYTDVIKFFDKKYAEINSL